MNYRCELIGWYLYDWANSAFFTTVVTVFLGPYLTEVARTAADDHGFLYPLGIKVAADSIFAYSISLAVFFEMILLPALGSIADYSNVKKRLLGFFAYAGAIATMGLYLLEDGRYLLGAMLFLIASFCVSASIVFYNAYLNEIANPAQRDTVSLNGVAVGYIGGASLLTANLWFFSNASSFGLSGAHAVRINLMSAGAWWAIFSLVPMLTLKQRHAIKPMPPGESYLTIGFKQLKRTLKTLTHHPQTMLFLVAQMLYNDGIQTVIALASQFGNRELGLNVSTLTKAVLMVQFIAFLGAMIFKRVVAALNTKQAIIISLLIWIAIIVYAYSALTTERDFYITAAVIGVVLGSSQALTRSLFSLMIPKGSEAEYFSLYEISNKGTSWLGPLLFGLALQFTASYRIAMLSLISFFILGLVLLIFVDVQKSINEAASETLAEI